MWGIGITWGWVCAQGDEQSQTPMLQLFVHCAESGKLTSHNMQAFSTSPPSQSKCHSHSAHCPPEHLGKPEPAPGQRFGSKNSTAWPIKRKIWIISLWTWQLLVFPWGCSKFCTFTAVYVKNSFFPPWLGKSCINLCESLSQLQLLFDILKTVSTKSIGFLHNNCFLKYQ